MLPLIEEISLLWKLAATLKQSVAVETSITYKFYAMDLWGKILIFNISSPTNLSEYSDQKRLTTMAAAKCISTRLKWPLMMKNWTRKLKLIMSFSMISLPNRLQKLFELFYLIEADELFYASKESVVWWSSCIGCVAKRSSIWNRSSLESSSRSCNLFFTFNDCQSSNSLRKIGFKLVTS